MVLEDYSLVTLRTRLANEFGKDETKSDIKTRIDNSINDAQFFLVNSFRKWPWLLKDISFDIPSITTTTGDLTNGSNQVANVASGPSTPLRSVMVLGEDPNTTLEGYTVQSVAGSTYTLDAAYRGSSSVAATISFVTGWLQLPDDFISMRILKFANSVRFNKMNMVSPVVITRLKRAGILTSVFRIFYTVVPDPLVGTANADSRLYLEIFPYLQDLDTLYGKYIRDVEKLVNDADIPIIPRSHRQVLLEVSKWFLAGHFKADSDRITHYRSIASAMITSMIKFFELSDEPELEEASPRLDFIPGPPGFPEFTE